MTAGDEGVVPAATIAGIALASALVPLNSTMIAVALPRIASDFDISTGRATVLITLYLVAMLVGQPLAGRVSDVLGARRLATIAAAGFGIFSAAAMVAGSFWLLVALRALQAAFAAALVPSVQAMLRDAVPATERGRAFGVQGSVLGVGAGLGPVIGGLATAAFGWRAIFGVNLPVVLAVLYVLQRRVPPLVGASVRRASVVFDDSGRLFNGVFGAAFSTQALSTFAQYALLLAVPIVLDSRGWSAASIGVALSSLTLGMVVMGPYGGRLGDRHGRRRPVILGLAVTLVAVAASALGGDHVPSAMLVLTLLLFGLGLGVASPSVMTAGIEAAPRARVGSAAGLLSASRYVGSIASTIVLAAVVNDDSSGLTTLLVVCAASLAVALAAARSLPRQLAHGPLTPPCDGGGVTWPRALDDLDRLLGADPDGEAPLGAIACYDPVLPAQEACDPARWEAVRIRADERRREWLGPVGDALRDLAAAGVLALDPASGLVRDAGTGVPLDRAGAESAVTRAGGGSPARA